MYINRGRIETMLECPRKYYYNYILDIVPKDDPVYFRIGIAVHKFLEVWYGKFDLATDERIEESIDAMHQSFAETKPDSGVAFAEGELITIQRTEKLMRAYANHYKEEEFIVVEPELEGVAPLGNGHQLVFRVDGIISYKDKLWLLEHKTTARLGPQYVNSFLLNHQVVGYVYGASKYTGYNLAGAVINMLRKESEYVKIEFMRQYQVIQPRHIKDMLMSFTYVVSDIAQRDPKDINDWPQHTGNCTNCPYFNICAHGAPEEAGHFYKTRTPDYVNQYEGK